MEVLTESRPKRRRTSSGGKSVGKRRSVRATEPAIVCLYGVVVQQTLVAGMELIEFEFHPDAA